MTSIFKSGALDMKKLALGVILIANLHIGMPTNGQVPNSGQAKAPSAATPSTKTFTEKDGLLVMDGMRRALESGNRGHLLALFDAKTMPGFAAFRDQVTQFFAQYESLQVKYHVTQTAPDGDFGSVVSDLAIDGASVSDGLPPVRRRVQLHLVLVWNGSAWKITDLTPRTLFQ
jgi:hypothetical protein